MKALSLRDVGRGFRIGGGIAAFAALVLLSALQFAHAAGVSPHIQSLVGVGDTTTPSRQLTVNADGSINVTGSFSASLSGFTPNGNVANLSVTNASGNVALPAGTVVAVANTGSNTAHIKLSVGAGTAATTDYSLQAGAAVGLTVGSNTYINAITDSSTTTLSIAGGSGLLTGYGAVTVSGTNAAAGATGAAVPSSASYSGGNLGGNLVGQTIVNPTGSVEAAQTDLASIKGVSVSTGTGAQGTGTPRVTVATDTATIAGSAVGTAGTASANVVTVQGIASGTNLPISGTVTANAGTNLNTSALATSANQPSNLAQEATTSGATANELFGCATTSAPTYTTAKSDCLSLTTAGGLRTDASATTQPVSGTVTANAGTNLNTSALSTSANQPSNLAQEATTSGATANELFGCATTSAPTYTTAKSDCLSLTTAGALRTDASATTQPVSGTVTTTPPSHASTNVDQLNGTTTDTNSGNKSAGTLRVVLATDQPALTNKLLVTPDSVALPANQSVNVSQMNGVTTSMNNGTTDTGTQRVTLSSDSTGQVKLTTGTSNIGTVQPIGATTGGISVFTKQVANNTTSFAVDASAGTLYGVSVFNNSGTIAYLKLYNTAQGSVTCGTPTPVDRIMIPANTNGAGAVVPFPVGIAYGTAITACVTTGFADNDTTAPAASTYLVDFYYK